MSFSWTSITPGTTIQTAAIWNELKTAVDHCTGQLSIGSYSFTHWNVTQFTDVITKEDMDEIRDAIDYVYDSNTCVAYNSSYNGTYA